MARKGCTRHTAVLATNHHQSELQCTDDIRLLSLVVRSKIVEFLSGRVRNVKAEVIVNTSMWLVRSSSFSETSCGDPCTTSSKLKPVHYTLPALESLFGLEVSTPDGLRQTPSNFSLFEIDLYWKYAHAREKTQDEKRLLGHEFCANKSFTFHLSRVPCPYKLRNPNYLHKPLVAGLPVASAEGDQGVYVMRRLLASPVTSAHLSRRGTAQSTTSLRCAMIRDGSSSERGAQRVRGRPRRKE